MPRASATPSGAARTRSPSAGRTATTGGDWTWTDYAERAARLAASLRELGRRPGRPGRADDAQPARVPRRRHRGDAARRDPDLDLQLLVAGPDRSTSSATAGRRSRSSRTRTSSSASSRCATSCPTLRAHRRRSTTGGGLPDGVLAWEDAARGASRSTSTPRRRSRSRATSRPSSTRRGRPGPPKGVMLDHANICWTIECLREAARRRRGRGSPARVVPADGAHRRADDLALPGRSRSATRSRRVPSRARSRSTSPQVRPRSSSRSRASGRRSHAGVHGDGGRRPGAQGAARRRARRRPEGVRLPRPRRGAPRRPRASVGDRRPRGPRAGALAPRARRVHRRDQRRGADRGRDLRLLPRPRRAALRDLRHERVVRADDLGRRSAIKAGTVGPAIPGSRCSSPRTAR